MAYYKTIAISIEEAIAMEAEAGFESNDEFKEVMREIADEYGESISTVYGIYFSAEMPA